ncbi:hypothetical protein AMJ39_06350 [candidate division TA06 bacterium DG_24]|uniref:Uncharacterized protein TP-0789 domain-containing protein n=3 Tax=Bacteria division TA06 TaxID=1156500 RepID=A0A0S8G892_UNCT6|nr:MAG: hypothetical protein AMJ39_06350 [candidate division TA06 bacterium DG_24]KPK69315.1 MAG: hypothetical protein AMJ82_05900 [candidate division TA06 bacterium SM23_40]
MTAERDRRRYPCRAAGLYLLALAVVLTPLLAGTAASETHVRREAGVEKSTASGTEGRSEQYVRAGDVETPGAGTSSIGSMSAQAAQTQSAQASPKQKNPAHAAAGTTGIPSEAEAPCTDTDNASAQMSSPGETPPTDTDNAGAQTSSEGETPPTDTDNAGAQLPPDEETTTPAEPETESARTPSQTEPPAPEMGEAPDVTRLLRRLDEMYESSGTSAQVEITIVKPDKTRTLRLRAWSKGDDKALIVIDAPARDAGTATLKVGRNLWNYLPKISRTIRVPPSMMMGSWMGTDLTNDDIVRESSYEEDYTSELVGMSADPRGWKVRLDARPDVAGLWNRVEIVFSTDEGLPVQAQFFDRKDRLSRTMRFEEVRQIGRRQVPTVMTVIPEREENEYTELRYLSIDFDIEVDDDMFSLSQLERRR